MGLSEGAVFHKGAYLREVLSQGGHLSALKSDYLRGWTNLRGRGGGLFDRVLIRRFMGAKSLPIRLYSRNVPHAIMTETRSPVSY